MSDLFPPKPTEKDLGKARRARGGAVVDAINIHGQDDFKQQERKPSNYVAPARAFCSTHRSHFCPCAAPHLYLPPHTRSGRDETAEALKEWNDSIKQ